MGDSRALSTQLEVRQALKRSVLQLMGSRSDILRAIGEVTNSFLVLLDFHEKNHQSLALADREKIESSIILTKTLLANLIQKYPGNEQIFYTFIKRVNAFDQVTAKPELQRILQKTQHERRESKSVSDKNEIAEEQARQEEILGQQIDLGENKIEEPVGPAPEPVSTPPDIKKSLDYEVQKSQTLNKEIKDNLINPKIEKYRAAPKEKEPERKRFVKSHISRRNSETPEVKQRDREESNSLRRRKITESMIEGSGFIEGRDVEEESSNYSNDDESHRSSLSEQSEQNEVVEQPGWLRRNWKALAIATLAITLFTVATIFTFGATGVVGAGVAAAGGVWAAGWSAFPAIGAMSALTAGVVILDGVAAGITITGLLFLAKEGIKKLFSPKPPSSGSEKKSVDLPKASQDSEQTLGSSYKERIGNRLTLDYSRRASEASSIAENHPQHGRSQGRRYGQRDPHARKEEVASSFNRDSSPSRTPSPRGRRGS